MIFFQNVINNLFSIWQRPTDFTIKKIQIPGTGFRIQKFRIRNGEFKFLFWLETKVEKGIMPKKLLLVWINGAFQSLLDFNEFFYFYKSVDILSCVKGTTNLYTVSES